MYISSFVALQTALSGVEAAHEQLATTGNNIANANNPDYSEQIVQLSPAAALTVAAGNGTHGVQVGTGVNATSITNMSDPYLDNAFRTQNAASSAATTVQGYATQLQSLLGENNQDGNGAISQQLQQFWTDWNDLADDPTNAGAKQAVVDDGQGVAATFSDISSGIAGLETQAETQYANLTAVPDPSTGAAGGTVYNDATQIAQLNVSIRQASAGGLSDNALIDQRNAALDGLSKLATTTVTQNSDGTVSVSFGATATPLVDGTQATAGQMVNWPQTLTSNSGGTLGGLLGVQGTLAGVSAQLDAVAGQLATSVNAATASSSNGVTSFFSGTTASTLAVNSTLVSTPSLVPTSATTDPGSNEISIAVAALSGGAPDHAYQAFVQSVGSIAQQATNTATNQSTLLTQVSNQRMSAEGVDMNQEMANLVQEQQAYEASAKVMGAFSTMMDSLMTVVGQS